MRFFLLIWKSSLHWHGKWFGGLLKSLEYSYMEKVVRIFGGQWRMYLVCWFLWPLFTASDASNPPPHWHTQICEGCGVAHIHVRCHLQWIMLCNSNKLPWGGVYIYFLGSKRPLLLNQLTQYSAPYEYAMEKGLWILQHGIYFRIVYSHFLTLYFYHTINFYGYKKWENGCTMNVSTKYQGSMLCGRKIMLFSFGYICYNKHCVWERYNIFLVN